MTIDDLMRFFSASADGQRVNKDSADTYSSGMDQNGILYTQRGSNVPITEEERRQEPYMNRSSQTNTVFSRDRPPPGGSRYLPSAASQGGYDARMNMADPRVIQAPAEQPATSGAGAGRGYVNPPMAANTLSPLESVMLPPRGPVTGVEAGAGRGFVNPAMANDGMNNPMQMAMNPTDQRLQAGTQQSPMAPMAPQPPERGFFDKFFNNQDANGNSAFMHAMRGLGAAGSRDPMKAMSEFAQQDNESAKNKAQIAQHMQPKVTHIPGTGWFQTTYPNGTTKLTENPELASSLNDTREVQINAGVQRVILQGQVTQANQQAQGDNKGASEARTSLNNVDMRLDSAKQALEAIAPVQKGPDGKPLVDDQGMPVRKVVLGMKDQLAAGFPGISGALGVDSVPILKQLADVRVDASAVKVAAAKGSVSDFESKLYLSPAPALTDNYEKVWLPWIQNQIKVGEKLRAHYQGEIARDQAPGANLPTRAEVAQPSAAAPTALAAPTASAAKAPMSIPGLSPRANKYFN